MLIISGPDLVGKSTAARRAAKRLVEVHDRQYMPMHLTRPPENFDYCDGYLAKMSRETVWDRFHIDSLVYRQLDDHACSMTPLKYSLVDAQLTMLGGQVLIITAHPDVIRARYGCHGEQEMYTLEHVLRINEAFGELVRDGYCHCRGAYYEPRMDAHFELRPGEESSLEAWVDSHVDRYAEVQDELDALLS